jgi:hypothetical protein
MPNPQIAQCIEQLCQCGCSDVRNTIARLEANQAVAQVEGLSVQERRQVLEELKAIMAVYDVRK